MVAAIDLDNTRVDGGRNMTPPNRPVTRRRMLAGAAALASVAAELGPMPVLSSMLAGSTPGVPWVDEDMAVPSSPAATWVALIEPDDPDDAGLVVEIVRRRFETTFSVRHEAPFTELLSLDVAEVDEPSGLARFEFSQVGPRRFDLEYLLYFEDAPFLDADPA